MSYPISPFPESFNYKLISSLMVEQIENKKAISNEDLTKTVKWLCSSPKITSIRLNSMKTEVQESLQIVKDHFKRDSLQSPNIYTHPCLSNTIIIESADVDKKMFIKYDKEVIVDTECGCAILRGAHVYAPGVLGMVSGCQINDNVSIYADISKKCKKGLQKIYSEGEKVFIGNGKVKLQRHQLFGENIIPRGIAVEVTETISGCYSINDNVLPLGHGLLQNLPSILCVQVLDPQPYDVVIDLCASPGNKTTHIAELMDNRGTLVAIDKTPRKVAQLKNRCEDFGAKVHAFQADSTSIVELFSNTRNITDGPPFLAETFDKVLLDAPCSVLGKRPQLVNRMTENEIKSYVPLQRKLFETAVNLLKPGGKMVYSTCTITLAENEGMVAWALRKFTNLRLFKPDLCLGGPGWTGSSLTEEELMKVQRFGPDDPVDSVGFFIANFIKK